MPWCCCATTSKVRGEVMREWVTASLLVLVGGVAFVMAALSLTASNLNRPVASGGVGELVVYAQTVEGPVALKRGRTSVMPRPQAIAFQFSVAGTGPRLVRIDIESKGAIRTFHEVRFEAPVDHEALGTTLQLDESHPDHLVLLVSVEAPHSSPKRRRYPIELATASYRFWDRSYVDDERQR